MSKVNILYGTITAILAVVFFVSTFTFPSEQRGLDPRVFPRFISICFFALSVGLIGSGVKSLKGEGKEQSKDYNLQEIFFSPARKRIWGIFLSALGYVAIIDTVGYLVATPPFLALSMLFFGEKKVWRILVTSIVTTALLFWLFRVIFRVPLPVSSLW